MQAAAERESSWSRAWTPSSFAPHPSSELSLARWRGEMVRWSAWIRCEHIIARATATVATNDAASASASLSPDTHPSLLFGSSPCPTNPAISICIHFYTCFTYTDRWFSTLSFLLPAEKEDPKSALRQATYTVSRPHCIPFLLSRPMIVHVRTIEMMVLKSVRLRSRPSGLKLSCINFSILKRSDMACVSTPRARVTDACKCVSANLRLPPAAAGTRSDGCDAQANRQ
jgi:hypothetical protein